MPLAARFAPIQRTLPAHLDTAALAPMRLFLQGWPTRWTSSQVEFFAPGIPTRVPISGRCERLFQRSQRFLSRMSGRTSRSAVFAPLDLQTKSRVDPFQFSQFRKWDRSFPRTRTSFKSSETRCFHPSGFAKARRLPKKLRGTCDSGNCHLRQGLFGPLTGPSSR